MKLAINLKQYRKNSGYSQEWVADEIGVSRPTLSNWESGKTIPDIMNLMRLSILFGTSIDDLMKEDVVKMTKNFRMLTYGAGFKDGKMRLKIDSGKFAWNMEKYPEVKANVNMETGEVKFFLEQDELEKLK